MYIRLLSPYLFFFCWIVLSIFPFIYKSNYIYEPLLGYFTITALYYSYHSLTNYVLPIYFKALLGLVFFLSIYGLALVLVGDDVFWMHTGQYVRKYLYLLWLIPAMLSVIPVYVFTCRGVLDEKKMKILFFVFFVISIYAFYGGLEQEMQHAALMHLDQEEFAVTNVYSFLSLLPLVVLFKERRILQFILLGIMLVYFVISAKRGAMILGGITAVLLVFSMFRNETLWKKFCIVFFSIFFIGCIYVFFLHQMESSFFFASKMERTLHGYASGRDEYARTILDYFNNHISLRQFLFGIGAQGTLSVNISFAHNDWLAILLEQGLIGVIVYSFYWICFVYSWIKSKVDYDAFVVIGLLIVIGFGKSLVSMYYLPIAAEMMATSGYFAIALGYFLGKAFPQYDFEKAVSLKDES